MAISHALKLVSKLEMWGEVCTGSRRQLQCAYALYLSTEMFSQEVPGEPHMAPGEHSVVAVSGGESCSWWSGDHRWPSMRLDTGWHMQDPTAGLHVAFHIPQTGSFYCQFRFTPQWDDFVEISLHEEVSEAPGWADQAVGFLGSSNPSSNPRAFQINLFGEAKWSLSFAATVQAD